MWIYLFSIVYFIRVHITYPYEIRSSSLFGIQSIWFLLDMDAEVIRLLRDANYNQLIEK